MPADLQGLPIAITGASSGIGRATALACARAGMPVALGARRADKLDEVRREIEGVGGRAVVVPMDVTSPEECRRLIDATVGEFGSAYAVFANAGYGLQKSVEATSDEEFRALMEVNFWGTMHTIRPALERMREAGRGHVVICSSSAGKIGLPYFAAYCASKGCQDFVGRALRHETPAEVHVSTVHPVRTRTEFFDVADRMSGEKPAVDLRTPEFTMQSAEKVARAIVRCLRRPRGEVWTSTTTRLTLALALALPGVADWGLGRYAKRARTQAGE